MTAHTDGHCFKTLSDYKLSTGCDRIFNEADLTISTGPVTYFGVSTTAGLLTISGTHSRSEVRPTVTGDAAARMFGGPLVGYSIIEQVTLIHRAQDVPGGGGGSGSGGGGAPPPNAAGPGRVGAADSGAQWAFLVSVCAIAMGSVFVLAL